MALPRFDFTARCRPFLELGVGDSRVPGAAARWDVQKWDQPDAVWSGVEPDWQDITCETYEIRFTMGHERTTDRFDVATMSVSATNVSGWADLHPPDPDDINTLMLRPGRSIRFGVDHVTLGRLVLWRGFVDVVDPVYEPRVNVVNLECVDALGEVGRTHITADVDTGAGEHVDTRLARILDEAQWPPSKRVFDGSYVTLLPVTLDGQTADLLGQAADSAGGAVYGDTDGSIVYRAMDWQTYPADRPADATIGNVELTDVCPTRWERPFARADMANRVILANTREPDADRVQHDDSSSWGLYGVEVFERSDLNTEDPAVLDDMADRYLTTRGPDTIPRVRSVSLDGRTGDDVVDLLAASSVYRPARYRCRLLLPRGEIFDRLHYLTGVNHSVSPEGWTVEMLLDIADVYQALSAPRWEPASGADAGLSRFERATWGEGAAA